MRILKCELSFCKYSTESSLYIGCQSIFNIIFKNLSTRDFTRNFKEIRQFFRKIAKQKRIIFYQENLIKFISMEMTLNDSKINNSQVIE